MAVSGGRVLLRCLGVHVFSTIVLPMESDLAQGPPRKTEPKAMAGGADVLFWALIPDNRRKSQEERNDREPGCPVMGLPIA